HARAKKDLGPLFQDRSLFLAQFLFDPLQIVLPDHAAHHRHAHTVLVLGQFQIGMRALGELCYLRPDPEISVTRGLVDRPAQCDVQLQQVEHLAIGNRCYGSGAGQGAPKDPSEASAVKYGDQAAIHHLSFVHPIGTDGAEGRSPERACRSLWKMRNWAVCWRRSTSNTATITGSMRRR